MSSDEYELLPHEELQKLREEVEELKKNPMGNVEESEDLKSAMRKMTKAMHQLINILTQTNDEMVHEFKRSSISKHFQKISDQNEAIAQALLGMAQLQDHHQNNPSQEQINLSPQNNIMADPLQTNNLLGKENIPNQFDSNPFETQSKDMNIPQNTMPGLDLPPPEHKKKGFSGLFK